MAHVMKVLGIIFAHGSNLALIRTECADGSRRAIPVDVSSLRTLQDCLDQLPRTVTGRAPSHDPPPETD